MTSFLYPFCISSLLGQKGQAGYEYAVNVAPPLRQSIFRSLLFIFLKMRTKIAGTA